MQIFLKREFFVTINVIDTFLTNAIMQQNPFYSKTGNNNNNKKSFVLTFSFPNAITYDALTSKQ